MKIALLGYGRMGVEVEKQALLHGHTVSAIFDINDNFSIASDLKGAQAIISFVTADAVLKNAATAAALGLPIVEGTTGWYAQLDRLEAINDISIVYSPNFSIGVYQFTKLAEYAAKILGVGLNYDCYVHEFHHAAKADSPSGTAKKLADVLLRNLQDKDKALYDTSHGVIDPRALHVTSTRVGRVPGVHEIGFDSPADEILLKHVAHGREGFAAGAVRAAAWIVGKKGVFTMEDFMSDLFPAL